MNYIYSFFDNNDKNLIIEKLKEEIHKKNIEIQNLKEKLQQLQVVHHDVKLTYKDILEIKDKIKEDNYNVYISRKGYIKFFVNIYNKTNIIVGNCEYPLNHIWDKYYLILSIPYNYQNIVALKHQLKIQGKLQFPLNYAFIIFGGDEDFIHPLEDIQEDIYFCKDFNKDLIEDFLTLKD
jgi:hypothetical protein